MVKIDYFEEFIESLQEHIFSINERHLIILKNTNSNKIIGTKENLSITISSEILKDLETILKLNYITAEERYIDYIVRGLVEQVIEYKYLISNEKLIEEYFGGKINLEEELDIESNRFNAIKELKKIGGNRYHRGRKKIIDMARDINEYKSTDETLSLYDIFSMSSDEIHNSYFKEYLDGFENSQDKRSLTEFHVTIIFIIIKKFLETYDQV